MTSPTPDAHEREHIFVRLMERGEYGSTQGSDWGRCHCGALIDWHTNRVTEPVPHESAHERGTERWRLHHDNWTDSDWLLEDGGESFNLDAPDDQAKLVLYLADLKAKAERGERWQELGDAVHAMAVEKGWWEDELDHRIPRLLDWIIEEATEAKTEFEAHRFLQYESADEQGLVKPEGLATEVIDIWLIVADLIRGLPMYSWLDIGEAKLAYNKVRRYKRDNRGDAVKEAGQ